VARRFEAGRRLAAERFGRDERISSDRVEIDPGASPDACRARTVRVNGRAVVEGGRLAAADLEEIRGQAREQAGRLWARMEAL